MSYLTEAARLILGDEDEPDRWGYGVAHRAMDDHTRAILWDALRDAEQQESRDARA
jgi:hypothetical protein